MNQHSEKTYWPSNTLSQFSYGFVFIVCLSLAKTSIAAEQTFLLTGLSNKLNVDFEIEVDYWKSNGEWETEILTIENGDRKANGHASFRIDLQNEIQIIGVSGVAKGKDQLNNQSVGVIPYKTFTRSTLLDSTSGRVTARLRSNINLIGYFYGKNAFLKSEDRSLGIQVLNRSLKKALELGILGGSNPELAKWNRVYGDYNALSNIVLDKEGIDVRNPFLEGAKSMLGEINPVVRMKLYLKFVTNIHRKKLNSEGPNGAGSIDDWAKTEIEDIIAEHFLNVSDRAREYLTSLESRDDLERCIEFSETVLSVANSIEELESKIKPRLGSTFAVDTLRSIMQKVTECVIGIYKKSTFDKTNNVNKATVHIVNRDEGQSLLKSYVSLYKRLRKQGWVSNSNERDKELSKYFNEFSLKIEE